jgi:hypothetical protein
VRITTRRPNPPRDPVFNSTLNQVSWTPPVDTALITHYRIRIGMDTAIVSYQPPVGQTSVQIGPGFTRMFLSSYNQTTDTESEQVLLDVEIDGNPFGGGGPYIRTLLIKDTTIGNDIADHVPIFIKSKAVRVIGVLRKAITSDLTVRVKLSGVALITLTIPHTTVIGVAVTSTAFVTTALADLSVLSWDITASDGSKDANGVASLTVQF